MPQPRLSRIHKATALVPLAILSGAWTASLATTSASATSAATTNTSAETLVPLETVSVPASVKVTTDYVSTVPSSTQNIVTTASASGIPEVALGAYQRSAQILASADASCGLDWTLLAAIGRVESNHGRFGSSTLDTQGLATPGIFGVPLDGTHGTALIKDTDGGQYDSDPIYDRAVGPMQFIPTTWSIVGVDGDGDGVRNPQDIDDASLATGVYLCSGAESLTDAQGLHDAIYRYNHSEDYVTLVTAIMQAYGAGNYTAVPNYDASPVLFDDSVFESSKTHHKKHHKTSTKTGTGGSSGSSDTPSTGGETTTTTKKKPTDLVTDVPKQTTETLTALQKATEYCKTNLTAGELDLVGGLDACVNAYLDGGATAVDNLLQTILDDLGLGTLGGLLN